MYQKSPSESPFPPHKHQLQPYPLKMCTRTLRKLPNPSKSRFRPDDDSNKPVLQPTQSSHDHDHDHQQGPSNIAQTSSSSSSQRQGRTATALVTRYDYSRNNEALAVVPSRLSIVKRGKHKRRVTIGSNQTSSSASSLGDVGGGGGGAEEADWPPFTDEDYIVFCFEEDGDFHVVTEENSKSQDCSEHSQKPQGDDEGELASPAYYSNDSMDGNWMSRRDCFLPNKAIEEELFYFSPRLQSDGIKSLTRFKAEVDDDEGVNIVKARGRVDEDMDYEDIDGIKNRGKGDEEEEDLLCEVDLECHKTSMECRDGSVVSTESSQSDQVGLPSSENRKLESSLYTQQTLLSNIMADEEDSVYLSPDSQKGGSQGDDESARVSAETSDTSQSETGGVQLEETLGSESAKSECSISSASSFEFPVMQWEWTGSPVKWPKSESFRLRKPKSRRVCLRCCRF